MDELVGVIDFFSALYATVGLGPDRVRFSTRPEKSVGADELWEHGGGGDPEAPSNAPGSNTWWTKATALSTGPKIDIDVRDAIGRYWQMATIQVDFQLPERFGLEYIDDARRSGSGR